MTDRSEHVAAPMVASEVAMVCNDPDLERPLRAYLEVVERHGFALVRTKKVGRPLPYACSCDGCWACPGHEDGCTCDVDWDVVYGQSGRPSDA